MLYSFAMMGMMSEMADLPEENKGRKFVLKEPKEPKPHNGHFHYWFRADGTFLSEKQFGLIEKGECVFRCFALNDKNAVKKFNAFIRSNEAE